MTDHERESQAAAAALAEFERVTRATGEAVRNAPKIPAANLVTQEQRDLAKLGVNQEFADNYLRRLADEFGNGNKST